MRDQALAAGFDAVGFAPASLPDSARAGLQAFLADGMQGDMGWLERRADERGDPRTLWSGARSVVVLGVNYGPDGDPRDDQAKTEQGAVSVYARGRDYHDLVKKRLKVLGSWMAESFECEVKVFVDTAPVMEKPLAQAAGLGWQGKHTNLLSRRHGSWLFLGEIFTSLDLAPDAPETDHCGACRACLDACPTRAFPAPYRLDARRCISYLTIEHQGPIPREFRVPMGNRIYGCDDCLAACPWNKFAHAHEEPDFAPRAALDPPGLAALAALDDTDFRAAFSKSPIKRSGRDRFLRNVLIAIGNSGAPTLISTAEGLLGDASPLVRGMAVWALSRLLPPADFAALRAARMAGESDPEVLAEWTEGDHD
ncbi:MAG: tRNA epoxyqueuosine(34) reductase QueG [Proteobacteria bacterium]|nr:tRNA epoxyqueuosine(34) reductase QueG [Pseudomonadota bacterium]